jgi:peptidyl-prolyl cis-trans isomerase B (cyclophilin B)
MTDGNYPGQQNQGYYAPVQQTNGMAIAALIMAFVFAPLGIILGHVARGQIKRTGEGGRGFATAGLVLGYVFTLISVVVVILVMVGVFLVVKNLPPQPPTFTDSPSVSFTLPTASPTP